LETQDPGREDHASGEEVIPPRRWISAATSSIRWMEPSETVIILDWDDTIFPTSWLFEKPAFKCWMADAYGHPRFGRDVEFSAAEMEELDTLDQAARGLVVSASALGHLGCVTLSKPPWQQLTMKRFLPRTAQVWEDLGVPVYYATEEKVKRTSSAACMSFVQDKEEDVSLRAAERTAQKNRSMRRFLTERCGANWQNILSIGDGDAERDAIMDISFQHTNPLSQKTGAPKQLRAKTVKMLDSPECAAMTLELQLLQAWLPGLVHCDEDEVIVIPESDDEIMAVHARFSE